MFIKSLAKKRNSGSTPVYLNVYDLTPINGYAYWFGLGVYHSGVQVHGVEYAYGAHEHPSTGIFEGEPRQCPGFVFRKSILIGRTDLSPREVRSLMEELATEYSGNTYHLIRKNCNHFCNQASIRLTGNSIPKWVNRLAKIGFLCNCVLPAHVTAVKSKADEVKIDQKKLRSNSTKFPKSSRNDSAKDTGANSTLSSSSSVNGRKLRRSSSASASSVITV